MGHKHSLAGVTNFYAGNALILSNVSESPQIGPIPAIRRSQPARDISEYQPVTSKVYKINGPESSMRNPHCRKKSNFVCPHGAGPFLYCHH